MEADEGLGRVDEALARLREGCLFFFKFDLAMIVAVATVVSFFHLEGDELLAQIGEYKYALQTLCGFVVYAIALEYFITSFRNQISLERLSKDASPVRAILRLCRTGYAIQSLAHAVLLMFALGYASAYVDGAVRAKHTLDELNQKLKAIEAETALKCPLSR